MLNKKIIKERERCRNIIIRKIDCIIEYRNDKIKKRKRRAISIFEKLKRDILFLVDNPDYKRKTPFTSKDLYKLKPSDA